MTSANHPDATATHQYAATQHDHAHHEHADHNSHGAHAGGERPAPGEGEVVEYTCPMHPEIRRPGPG